MSLGADGYFREPNTEVVYIYGNGRICRNRASPEQIWQTPLLTNVTRQRLIFAVLSYWWRGANIAPEANSNQYPFPQLPLGDCRGMWGGGNVPTNGTLWADLLAWGAPCRTISSGFSVMQYRTVRKQVIGQERWVVFPFPRQEPFLHISPYRDGII